MYDHLYESGDYIFSKCLKCSKKRTTTQACKYKNSKKEFTHKLIPHPKWTGPKCTFCGNDIVYTCVKCDFNAFTCTCNGYRDLDKGVVFILNEYVPKNLDVFAEVKFVHTVNLQIACAYSDDESVIKDIVE